MKKSASYLIVFSLVLSVGGYFGVVGASNIPDGIKPHFLRQSLEGGVLELSNRGRDFGVRGDTGGRHPHVPGEIVVKFKDGGDSVARVKTREGETVDEAIERFSRLSIVEYAEPNYIAEALLVPNDQFYSYQWHFDNAVFGGVEAEQAWDIGNGGGVIVAVVDTGVAYENFTDGVWNFKKAPDLANTTFVAGYDFVNDDTHPNDDDGHGTHVTGTIAQSTNNVLGVAGLAHGAAIMPIKVLDRSGSGTYTAIASGIRFAADNGAKVINLSLGGPSPAQILEDALAYAHDIKGVTIVAAAGNGDEFGNGLPQLLYPAAYNAYVIAVGATGYDETRASYSNFGTGLDIVAPGGDLSVDKNGDLYGDGVLQQTFGRRVDQFGYYFFQGTSMSSPHVAAAAAMILSKGNAATPAQVKQALEESADDLGAAGWDATYGNGLLNVAKAFAWSAGPVDNPPTVSILEPANNARVAGIVNITADAADDVGLQRVEIYADAQLLATLTVSPFTISWDTTTFSEGNHVVKAVAFDTALQSTSKSTNVFVDNFNDAPVANAGPDKSATVGVLVNFDGSASFDPDGSIVSYGWNFGDGATASGALVSHIYSAAGTYTVALTVADNGGLISSDTAIVTVTSLPSMHVGNISLTKAFRSGGRCKVSATVPIRDSANAGVSGAAVNGGWSGAYKASVNGTTGSTGNVTFSTPWISGCGTFTFTVTNVSKTGWVYNSTHNIETSDTI